MSQNTQTLNPDVPEDHLMPGEVRREVLSLSQMSGPLEFKQSVATLLNLCVSEDKRTWSDFAKARDIVGQRAALRLLRFALGEISKDIEKSAAAAVRHYRRELEAIEPLPATPEEATAHIYWQAMEKLDAAGLSFDALFDYHCQDDGETEA